jgi:hypothetical protein
MVAINSVASIVLDIYLPYLLVGMRQINLL